MTTVIGGSAPSITFSDSTTQSTAALPLTGGQLSGNLTFATGTNGIVFNNSSATTNSTLNDYETGTWTPVVNRSTTSPSVTYGFQVGYYTKVGNLVYIIGAISWTANSGGSGTYLITGLPFTSQTNAHTYPQIMLNDIGNTFSWGTGYTQVGLEISPSTTQMAILASGNGVTSTTLSFPSASSIYFSGTYLASF